MLVVAVALAAASSAPATAAPAAGQAATPARLSVLTTSTDDLVSTRRLRLRVAFRRVGTVRLYARIGSTRLAVARLARFRKPGRKRVSLRLTRPAARLLRAAQSRCRSSRLVVSARARRYRTPGGRVSFRRKNRSRRSRTVRKVRTLRTRCANGTAPGGGKSPGANPGGPGPGPPVKLRAGAASSDITPPIGTPMFAYTARSNIADPPTDLDKALQIIGDPDTNLYAKTFEPSEGIHTRVRARALVVEQAGRKFAMVQADLGGLPFALTQEVVSRIEETGIPAERLMISATHTHASTGPIWPLDSTGYAALGGDAFDPRIFELTAEGIAEAIRDADARLEPAKLGVGSSSLTNASRNREFDTFRRNPEAPADEAAARAASIDEKLWVVRADSRDGRPLAVWSNFAIHPTSFGDDNLLFSGDNAAAAERIAEDQIEQEAADAGRPIRPDRELVNVWTNGNQGDISPNGDADRDDAADPLQYVPNASASAHMAGRRVAAGIVSAWRDAGADMSDTLKLDARRTIFAFDGMPLDSPVGPLPVLGAGGIVADDGTCLPVALPGQGLKVPIATGPLAPNTAPVSVWRIGALGIVGLPSEVTKTQGARIRNALVSGSDGELTDFALAGLTNAYLSYTATPEEYDGCTYQGSFTLFGRLQGPRYGSEANGVLAALLAGQDPPSLPEPPPTGLGGNLPTADQTPDAGDAVAQPADTARFGRATFKWKGGDPAVDAARNATFVALQRFSGGDWATVGTDDGFLDTTAFDDDTGVWTESWQFGECDPLGQYRFVVTGVADKGAGPEAYTVTSDTFVLGATAPLAVDPVNVTGTTATVVARYPDPGPDALIALPRRVRTGTAALDVNGHTVQAGLDAEKLRFTAQVPPGATVSVTDLDDGCGNGAG